jgi:hypothetical protein
MLSLNCRWYSIMHDVVTINVHCVSNHAWVQTVQSSNQDPVSSFVIVPVSWLVE